MTKKVEVPDGDLYPAEEREARINAMMRACLNMPPKDEAERALRKQISDDLERQAARFSNHSPKYPRK